MSVVAFAQTGTKPTQFWKTYGFGGEMKLNGFYRSQFRQGNQFSEKQQSTLYSAGILLKLRNYIWSPRFMMLDLEGEYTPDRSNEKFLVIPEQTENRDLRKVDARLSFLPQNKISLTSYFNYGKVYNNRENLSSIKLTGTNWGASLFYRAKKVPITMAFTSSEQDESEIQTGRRFLSKQNIWEARANTSFGKKDRNELMVSYNDFYRRDFSKSEVVNLIKNASYTGAAFWGRNKRSSTNTYLAGIWQEGYDPNTRYQAIENINVFLGKKLQANLHYNYYSDQRNLQEVYQHRGGADIQHQLFESLHTIVGYDYNATDQTQYTDRMQLGYADMAYTKKILKKHQIDLSYRYNLQSQKWNSQDGTINILNENISLSDGQIKLLSRPYVSPTSIEVKDASGTIIYQLNVDYLVIAQNQFIQIQRVPGGLIPNNGTVFVDYTAIQPGTYEYISSNYQLSAGLSFYKKLINFYYRKSVQDYYNLKKTDFITLNYFDQQVGGARIDYKAFNGGAEYENMNSTVLPYELYRYYINYQTTIKKKIIFAINGNFYDYKKLNAINNIQFIDLYGSLTFYFTPQFSWGASVSYRKQTGEGVNLDLLNARSELIANLHKLRFSVLYNYYDRSVAMEKVRYNAVNVQIARKF